jgi:hypothetical protein
MPGPAAFSGKYLHIGDLAKALNRDPITIRAWIRTGIIPDAPRKTHIRHDRQWTAGELSTIVGIASEEAILSNPGLTSARPTSASGFGKR